MTFTRPELLVLAPLLLPLLVLALVAQWRRHRRLGDAFGGPLAAGRLTSRDLYRFPTRRLLCLGGSGLAISLAAAGPHLGSGISFDSSKPIDLVIAVDISASMAAGDVEPSRIERAKEVVYRLSEAMTDERVGLVVFADWPYTLVPLTDDHAVLGFFTESLNANLIGARDQGTSLSAVIGHAREDLDARRRPGAERVILLLTDGEAHEEDAAVLDSVTAGVADGVQIWTAGVGTQSGSQLERPGSEGAPMSNDDGVPVVTRMNELLLRRIAELGDGTYQDVSEDAGLRALVTRLRRIRDGEERPLDPSFWLTLLAIPLLLLDGVMDTGGKVESRRVAGETR